MSDIIELTDAELGLVSGGLVVQANISTITQTATATNSGAVSASATGSGSTAIAIGAAASNTAVVEQLNVFSVRFGRG